LREKLDGKTLNSQPTTLSLFLAAFAGAALISPAGPAPSASACGAIYQLWIAASLLLYSGNERQTNRSIIVSVVCAIFQSIANATKRRMLRHENVISIKRNGGGAAVRRV
jgi:hypothetical protein